MRRYTDMPVPALKLPCFFATDLRQHFIITLSGFSTFFHCMSPQ